MRDSEERHVFYIGVVFRSIGDNMMDIVVPFPPTQAQSSKVVRNDHAKQAIGMEIVSDTHMTSIMGSENELVPETSKE